MSLPPTSPVPPSSLASARSASQLQVSQVSSSSLSSSLLSLPPASLPPASPSSVASDWSPPRRDEEVSPPTPSDGLSDSLTSSQFVSLSHEEAKEAEEEHRRQQRLRSAEKGGKAEARERKDEGQRPPSLSAAGAAAAESQASTSGTSLNSALWAATLQMVADERLNEEKKEGGEGGGEEGKEEGGVQGRSVRQEGEGEEAAAVGGGSMVACEVGGWRGRVSSLLFSSLSPSSAALPLCLFSLSLVCLGFLLGHRYGRYSERLLAAQQGGAGGGGLGGGRGGVGGGVAGGIAEVVSGLMRAMAAEQEKQLSRIMGSSVAVKWTGQR